MKVSVLGYEFPRNVSLPINAAWVKQLPALKPLSDLSIDFCALCRFSIELPTFT
jgi:hypothetical protein